MRHDFSGLTHRAERYFSFLPGGFRPRGEVFYNSFVPLFPRVPYVLEEAVRGTLAATDHPKAATADPKMFFDNRFLQEFESSGFVKELYGNK